MYINNINDSTINNRNSIRWKAKLPREILERIALVGNLLNLAFVLDSAYVAKRVSPFAGEGQAVVWATSVPGLVSDATRRTVFDLGDLWSHELQRKLLSMKADIWVIPGAWELAYKQRAWASPRCKEHHLDAVREWLRQYGTQKRCTFATLCTKQDMAMTVIRR